MKRWENEPYANYPQKVAILNKTNKKKSPVAEATGPDEDHNFTGLGPVVM